MTDISLNDDIMLNILSKCDNNTITNCYQMPKLYNLINENENYITKNLNYSKYIIATIPIKVLIFNDIVNSYNDKPAIIFPNGSEIWCDYGMITQIKCLYKVDVVEETPILLDIIISHIKDILRFNGNVVVKYNNNGNIKQIIITSHGRFIDEITTSFEYFYEDNELTMIDIYLERLEVIHYRMRSYKPLPDLFKLSVARSLIIFLELPFKVSSCYIYETINNYDEISRLQIMYNSSELIGIDKN